MPWSARSRSRLEAALLAAALLGVGLMVSALPAVAGSAAPRAPAPTGTSDAYTLYGDAGTGWGFAANNTTRPGPTLRIGYGDTVQLTLIAADQANHNWFIDYNNNSFPDPGEPSSPVFSNTNSIVWNFTADGVGTFIYRCKVHPGTMWGVIVISAPTRYTLYGAIGLANSTAVGWGFNATNLSAPGPTLIIEAGVNVTLTLHSADGVPHSWFIDYDNNSAISSGEAVSQTFGGSGNPNPVNDSFTATRTGTYVYRCGIHTAQMWGVIVILGHETSASNAFPIGLIPGIMLVVIGGLLILGVVYQVRATRAARLRK